MSDEEAPRTEDTPNTPDPDTPDIPWQKRYEDLRPEFDRTTQALKEHESVWDDEDMLLKRVEEKFPHLLTGDDEPAPDVEDDDEDEPQFVSRTEFERWQAEQRTKESDRLFATDLKELTAERELPKPGKEWVTSRYQRGEFQNAGDLKKALDEWYAYEDSLRGPTEEPEPPKQRPRAPHVPSNGKAQTGVPDWSQMSQTEIDKYMAERALALSQQ